MLLLISDSSTDEIRLGIRCPHPEAFSFDNRAGGAAHAIKADAACNLAMLLGGLPAPQYDYFCRWQQYWAAERLGKDSNNRLDRINSLHEIYALSRLERSTGTIHMQTI